MSSEQTVQTSRAVVWTGRVLSALPVLMLILSGAMKLSPSPEIQEEFTRLGYSAEVMFGIGIVEIACAVIYAIPQTAFLGAILLTGYLGGAVATHVRIGDSFIPPIIGGVLVWLGLYLRDPRLRALVPLRR